MEEPRSSQISQEIVLTGIGEQLSTKTSKVSIYARAQTVLRVSQPEIPRPKPRIDARELLERIVAAARRVISVSKIFALSVILTA